MMEPVEYRWSGMVMETIDGLAFIGRNPMDKDNVYIVTGDSGMGLTHGTIAGILLTDLICGRRIPGVRSMTRRASRSGAWRGRNSLPRTPMSPRKCQGLAGRRRRFLHRRHTARRGSDHAPGTDESRRVPRRARHRPRAFGGVPAPGLHRPLERSGENLGLPLSRLPLRPEGGGHRGTGQLASGRGMSRIGKRSASGAAQPRANRAESFS